MYVDWFKRIFVRDVGQRTPTRITLLISFLKMQRGHFPIRGFISLSSLIIITTTIKYIPGYHNYPI